MQESPDPFVGDQSRDANERRKMAKDFVDYEIDQSRIARLVPNPISLWRFDEDWHTGEEVRANEFFGNGGMLSAETLENSGFGMDVQRDRAGRPTTGTYETGKETDRGATFSGDRVDPSPPFLDTFGDGDEKMKREGEKGSPMSRDIHDLFKDSMAPKDAAQAAFFASAIEGMEKVREGNLKAEMNRTHMNQDGMRYRTDNGDGYIDERGNFVSRETQERDFAAAFEAEVKRVKEQQKASTQKPGEANSTSNTTTESRDEEELLKRRMQRKAEREALKAERNRKHEAALKQRHRTAESIFETQIKGGGLGVPNPDLFTDDRSRAL